MSIVSLVRYKRDDVSLQEAIEKSLKLIGYKINIAVKSVAIKPNLCYYWDYSTGETTDPSFIGTLVDVLRKHMSEDATISIVESDASAMRCKHVFRMLGYEKLAKTKQIQLVNLTNDESEEAKVITSGQEFKFSLPKTIGEANLMINVPKIKYMERCRFSGTLKNIYGCNPYPRKHKYHAKLAETIVSLNKIMKPDLCILDGIIVKGVAARRIDLIAASKDSVALDSVMVRIAGMNPHSIRHLELAQREGLGSINPSIVGEPIEYFRGIFPRRGLRYSARRLLSKIYGNVQKSVFK